MKKLILTLATLALTVPAVHAQEAAPQANGDRMFAMIDANGDGKLDKDEVTKMMAMRAARNGDSAAPDPAKIDAFMKHADTNGDGAIDRTEIEAIRKARAARHDAEKPDDAG